jgi:small membrane protein
MIAKLILTFLLAGVVLYAWHEQGRSPLVAKLSLIAATAGIYFVWVPSHASDFAAWAGVGRGVDLIIYIWVVISLLVMLNLHLKLRVQLELITSLARQSAIANARPRKPDRVSRPRAGARTGSQQFRRAAGPITPPRTTSRRAPASAQRRVQRTDKRATGA